MTSLLVRDTKSSGGLRPNRSLRPPNTNPEAEEDPGHYRQAFLLVLIDGT